MDENDVINIMRHPQTMIASDGRLVKLGDGHPHQMVWNISKSTRTLCKRKKGIKYGRSIHKMTFLPAKAMGLKDRGLIKIGNKADLTLFNPNTIIDNATFTNPHNFQMGLNMYLLMENWQLTKQNSNLLNPVLF